MWNQDWSPLLKPLAVGNYVNGQCGIKGTGSHPIAVSSPSEDIVLKLSSELMASSAADVDAAAQAAKSASVAWRKSTVEERSRVLKTLGSLVRRDAKYLAQLESLSCGLCLRDTLVSMESCASCFDYFSRLVWSSSGCSGGGGSNGMLPNILDGSGSSSTRLEPVGVVGLITPFNYPLEMGVWKMAPAIAAGNAVVWKPPELAPLTALRFSQILAEAADAAQKTEEASPSSAMLPPNGLINIVHGVGDTAGKALVAHDDIDLVGFTGSVSGGRQVQVAAAQAPTMKRVNLELGGNGFGIVAPDYQNIEYAAQTIVASCFTNAGQSCTACRRAVVPRSKLDAFVEAAVKAATTIKLGHAMDPAVEMGPLINQAAVQRVLTKVHEATTPKAGAKNQVLLVTGGFRPDFQDGAFATPTIVLATTPEAALESSLFQDELFGPVLCVIPYGPDEGRSDQETKDLEEALRIANSTRYGLSCSVFTDSMKGHQILTEGVQAGTCWVNAADLMNASTPFGGIKNSGYGKDLGEQSLASYSHSKTVTLKRY